MRHYYIVLDDGSPLRQYAQGLYIFRHATAFKTYAKAYYAAQQKKGEFYGYANQAPSRESDIFKNWMKRAESVRVVRVEVPE